MGRKLCFDIETNNLLRQLTRLHLLIIRDLDTDEEFIFRENDAREGVKMLAEADLIVGHNVVNFDIPALEKLYGDIGLTGKIRDTIILTRLLFSNVKEDDYALQRKGALPGKYLGSHSLKAWGFRLGEFKGEYDASTPDAWAEWTPEMEDYARQDVVVTVKLWRYLERKIAQQKYSQEAIVLEHQFADLLTKIEQNGFPFDEAEAKVLYETLKDRKTGIEKNLLEQFRPWWRAKWQEGKNGKPARWKDAEVRYPKKTLNYADPLRASFTLDAPFCPVTLETFNPGSRDQIADRLQRMFGWKPEQFTPTGKPRVSEDILRDLVGALDEEEDGIEETEEELYDKLVTSVPQAKNLADYFLVQKRIGQLAEGKNGWLKLVVDGKVHGSVNGLGAVTRRVTHAKPNMSQTPAVRSPYGKEMRRLWRVPPGWLQFGVDLSGVEIRCFADVLAEFDGGAYADIVIHGDVHTENMKAFGVPTRDAAKTTLYAMLYGGGNARLGSIIGQGADAGNRIKRGFLKAVPAYGKVVQRLHNMVDRQGWIPALDGGRLHVRSPHKALNTSLQSAGALVAKKWSIGIEEELLDAGMKHGWDGDFAVLGFFHDELAIAIRAPHFDPRSYSDPTDYAAWEPEDGESPDGLRKRIAKSRDKQHQTWYLDNSPEARLVAEVSKRSIKDVEKHFEFACPLDCEFKVGLNWADCH